MPRGVMHFQISPGSVDGKHLKITHFFLGYLWVVVHDKPRDRFITPGGCERSFVFVKPVGNIRGYEQWC